MVRTLVCPSLVSFGQRLKRHFSELYHWSSLNSLPLLQTERKLTVLLEKIKVAKKWTYCADKYLTEEISLTPNKEQRDFFSKRFVRAKPGINSGWNANFFCKLSYKAHSRSLHNPLYKGTVTRQTKVEKLELARVNFTKTVGKLRATNKSNLCSR